MQVELFLVPPGARAFRDTVREKAVKGLGAEGTDYSGLLYLAPSKLLVRAFRRDFHSSSGDCYIPPGAHTLREFSLRLFREFRSDLTLLKKPLVPLAVADLCSCSHGLASITAEFIGEMKRQFPGDDTDTMRKRLQDVFEELGMPQEVSERAYQALQMMDKYQGALIGSQTADEDDALALAAEAVSKMPPPKVLMLDGFYEVTPAEQLFIKNLIRHAATTLISIPISSPEDDLSFCYSHFIEETFGGVIKPLMVKPEGEETEKRYVTSPSRQDEAEAMARYLKAAFVSGTGRDLQETFVAFPQVAQYRETIERVFHSYGIPFEMTDPRPLGKCRAYIDLMSMLEAAGSGFQRLPTARFLSSPHFFGIPQELKRAVPAIALDAGRMKGKGAWLRELGKKGLLMSARNVLSALEPLYLPDNKSTYIEFINVLIEVLGTLGFKSSEHNPEGYRDFLRGLSGLDAVVGGKTSLRGFTDALGRLLESTPEPPEPGSARGVVVAGLNEMRGLEPAFLLMGGLKDGDIPARLEMDLILPDSARARLGLMDMHRHLRLQGHNFTRLSSSALKLRMSYPEQEANKVFLPTVFLMDAEQAEEKLFGIFSPEEDLVRQGVKPFGARMREVDGIKRYEKGKAIDVTAIDAYRYCPRRFFIERVLRLEPPKIIEYEIEPRTMGSIVHEVMERLVSAELVDWDTFKHRAATALEVVLKKPEWELEPYFMELITESFMQILPEIYGIETDIAAEGYVFQRAEHRVEGEPLPGIKLKGKVDRIDVRGSTDAFIIDYKTGAGKLSSTALLKRGEALQLFLYAAMLKASGYSALPKSVAVYSLKDMALGRIPNKRDIKQGRTLDEFIDAALWFLDATVADMWEGQYPARPMTESNCRNCHERPNCPYIQGAG